MKPFRRICLLLLLIVQVQWLQAQFSKASLQATGLTCAMCSNAINKALQKLPFVESVKSDIKNSSFSIVFRPQSSVNLDAMKDAVEAAGFFVGGLQVTGTFNQQKTGPDGLLKIGNSWFCFLRGAGINLNGEMTLTLKDRSFQTAKSFKKFSSTVKVPSLSTGKAISDMEKSGVKKGERIYHVTIG